MALVHDGDSKVSFILAFLLFLSGGAFADELSPEVYLGKISQRLTGQWPTPDEYALLSASMASSQCRESHCLTNFFTEYIRLKLDSPQFYSEAVLKTYEKFGFQIPQVPPFPFTPKFDSGNDLLGREPLLVYRVFKQNLSVNELFSAQTYWLNSVDLAAYTSAVFTLPITWEKLPSSHLVTSSEVPEITLPATLNQLDYRGHPNVAGLFSTKKFMDRYWNTPSNAGFKRAAAVFKVMLCDRLFPSIERKGQKAREEALALGSVDQKISDRTLEEIHKNRHANQEDCRKCHDRLNPMALTMRPLEVGISQFPSPGRLRVFSAFG